MKQKSRCILRSVRGEEKGNTIVRNEQVTIPEIAACPFVKDHGTIVGIWTDVDCQDIVMVFQIEPIHYQSNEGVSMIEIPPAYLIG